MAMPMNIHEYQAKDILRAHGVPIPAGAVAANERDARRIVKELGGKVVIKAQVHAGGRGKGRVVSDSQAAARMFSRLDKDPAKNEGQVKGRRRGGVRLADGVERALGEFRAMRKHVLVSRQTGPKGAKISAVLIEQQTSIAREFYASILVDGSIGRPLVIVSSEGGQSIEEVAAENPSAIHRLPIDPKEGFPAFRARQLAQKLGLPSAAIRPAGELLAALYRAFLATDATQVEINPFILAQDGSVLAIDAKINIDDNAAFRHDADAWRDATQEDPIERAAEQAGIGSYIKLDGNIGCMVNGAGLAMATMDAIKLEGGEPANFLDIGTVNREDRVIEALRIIHRDRDVKAILINIFGGLARVDIVAEGVVKAVRQLRIKQPIIVRLNGSNVEEGRRILEESGVAVQTADALGDAARLAAEAAA